MGKKRAHSEVDSEGSDGLVYGKQYDSNGNEEFAVEVISAARVVEGAAAGEAVWQYNVQWAGYGREDDSWEPVDELNVTCDRLCRSFWAHVGNEDMNDYEIGYQVTAKPAWIAQEKEYYRNELKKAHELRARKERKKAKRDEAKAKATGKAKGKGKEKEKEKPKKKAIAKPKESSSESSEDEKPLAPPTRKGKAKAKVDPKKKPPVKQVVQESSSDSDSEVPLAKSSPPKRKASGTVPVAAAAPKPTTKSRPSFAPPPDPPKPPKRPQVDTNVSAPSTKPSPALTTPASAKPKPKPLPLPSATPTPTTTTPTASTSAPPKKVSTGSDSSFFSIKKKPPTTVPRTQIVQDPTLTGTYGNATKQRLGQQIGSDKASGSTSAATSAPAKKPALPSFKKKPAAAPLPLPPPRIDDPRRPSATSSALPLPPPSRPVREVSPPESVDHDSDFFGGDWGAPDAMDVDQPDFSKEVDDFLKPLLPNDLAAPLTESTSNANNDQLYGRGITGLVPTGSKAKSVKIPKKFRWSGLLEVDIGSPNEEPEQLCEVVVTDVTQPLPNGLQFSYVLRQGTSKSLRVPTLHDSDDLRDFMLACAPVPQMAKVAALEEKDRPIFESFVAYLLRTRRVALIPMMMDGNVSGHIVVFPSSLDDLSTRFKLPPNLQDSSQASLVAALLPWNIPVSQRMSLTRPWPSQLLAGTIEHEQYISDDVRWKSTIGGLRGRYQLAMRVLRFPKELHDFLSTPDPSSNTYLKTYVFYEGGDGQQLASPATAGIQTLLLYSILERCRVQPVPYKKMDEAGVVFVHCGALEVFLRSGIVNKLRRRDRPDVEFWVYGSHENVDWGRWGVKCIFPYGGVVTLTARCLLENMMGSLTLVEQLAEHPLWDCYVLPEVLGAAAKELCPSADPLDAFDKGNFALIWLLDVIEEGHVSLMRSPPQTCPKPGDIHSWTMDQIKTSVCSRRELLVYALQEYESRYAGIPSTEGTLKEGKMVDGVEGDLTRLQMHPSVYEQKRRYIVLGAKAECTLDRKEKSGVEWMRPEDFTFEDDYFNE